MLCGTPFYGLADGTTVRWYTTKEGNGLKINGIIKLLRNINKVTYLTPH